MNFLQEAEAFNQMTDNELSLVNKFLSLNEESIKSSVGVLLKVYSEQIILLILYTREIISREPKVLSRLRLISFIDEELKEDYLEDLRKELIRELDNGCDFFTFFSLLESKEEIDSFKIRSFLMKYNILFDSLSSSNFNYSFSQMSMSLFKGLEILKKLVIWIDEYTDENLIYKKICERRSKNVFSGDSNILEESNLKEIDTSIITKCNDMIGDVYEIINKYMKKDDFLVKKEILNNNENISFKSVKLTFDFRLLSEGSPEVLMQQIENELFGKEISEPYFSSYSKKAVDISYVSKLDKWHKNNSIIFRRLNQVPRYIASIIENDIRLNTSEFSGDWYEYITNKIEDIFKGSKFMGVWCSYNEKSTHERFKKRVKINNIKNKSFIEIISKAIKESKNYPLQSTAYPPLWISSYYNSVNVTSYY